MEFTIKIYFQLPYQSVSWVGAEYTYSYDLKKKKKLLAISIHCRCSYFGVNQLIDTSVGVIAPRRKKCEEGGGQVKNLHSMNYCDWNFPLLFLCTRASEYVVGNFQQVWFKSQRHRWRRWFTVFRSWIWKLVTLVAFHLWSAAKEWWSLFNIIIDLLKTVICENIN